MQSLSANHRAGRALALVRPAAGRTKRSLATSKNIKSAVPHAKGSHDNAAVEVSGKNSRDSNLDHHLTILNHFSLLADHVCVFGSSYKF